MESLLILGGFSLVLLGVILVIFREKDNKAQNAGQIIISGGFTIVAIATSMLYTNAVNKSNIIEQQEEIEYSTFEVDSITGDTIYRECTLSL